MALFHTLDACQTSLDSTLKKEEQKENINIFQV